MNTVRGLRAWAWLALLLPLLAAPAYAADDQQGKDDKSTKLDKVEITGSRIKRVQVEGIDPVMTISRNEIDKSGVTSVGEFLQQLTSSGSALNTKFNSSGNFGFPPDGGGVGAGSTQVDLRHLKSKRVLVLVDGQRWVNESSASGISGAVDLNTIPLSIVERVEVLLDGASTVYGSDAIAGVVNVITRKDFDGLEARASDGQYLATGDGQTQSYELSMGKSDAKSAVYFGLSFTDAGTVSASDRAISQEPVPGTGVTRGSSATPQGRFDFLYTNSAGGLCDAITFECDITTPAGSTFPGSVPVFPANFIPWSGSQRFNFQPYNLVLTPSQRTSAFIQGRYELSDSINFHSKFLYNTRNSLNRAAPEPIFLGSDAGNGNIGDHVVIDVTNPYNPFGITLDADGGNAFFLTRRPLEGGPRLFSQNTNTYYFGMGFDGSVSLFDHSWDWNVDYIYSRNQAVQETRGTYNIAHIVRGLGPLAACTAPCVPINLFGGAPGATLTPAMLQYMLAVLHDTSQQEMRSYTANASGDLLALPGGNLGAAIGIEHREQSGNYQPDTLSSSGEANGVPSQPSAGRFSVNEAYAEFSLPVVSGARYADLLEFDVSGRWSDYSTSGSTSTYKLGGRWRMNDEFLFRATYSEGFRAPTIGELFGAQSRFDAVLNDPCSGNGVTVPAPCLAFGVPNTYQQLNPQISILTGGNSSLKPETSKSFVWGFVYGPAWARDLPWTKSLDVDANVYRYTVSGAISALDAQTQLDNCVGAGPASSFCNGIVRNVNGVITSFGNTLLNLGSIETNGMDVNFTWRLEETSVGRFTVSWANSFVSKFTANEPCPGGFCPLPGAGIERNDSGIPKWQSNLQVNWSRGAWTGVWTMRTIDKLTESCSDFLDGTPNSLTALGLCSNPNVLNESLSTNQLGRTTYHDVQFAYDYGQLFGMDTTFKVGINNLFDHDPPICLSCSLNGYDASTYDVPGRFGYVAIVGRFQ